MTGVGETGWDECHSGRAGVGAKGCSAGTGRAGKLELSLYIGEVSFHSP